MGIINLSKSNNYLIWVVLFFIAFGFGKCENIFEIFKGDIYGEFDKKNRHKDRRNKCYSFENMCKSKDDSDIFSKLLKSNCVFVLLIVVLIILCKDSKEQCEV